VAGKVIESGSGLHTNGALLHILINFVRTEMAINGLHGL